MGAFKRTLGSPLVYSWCLVCLGSLAINGVVVSREQSQMSGLASKARDGVVDGILRCVVS